MPSHEQPRKGNPNQLPIRQHVFPRRSIERFCGADRTVSLRDLQRELTRSAGPNDAVFCAMRAWTLREEAGVMRDIEAAFQAVVEALLASDDPEVPARSYKDISRFYALWESRACLRKLPRQEEEVVGVTGNDLTKEQEENLESNGYLFVRKGGKLPARQLNGLQIMRRVDWVMSGGIGDSPWGLLKAHEGEFVVPDMPKCAAIPITPTMCLAANAPHGSLLRENVALINSIARGGSSSYYFARNLNVCP